MDFGLYVCPLHFLDQGIFWKNFLVSHETEICTHWLLLRLRIIIKEQIQALTSRVLSPVIEEILDIMSLCHMLTYQPVNLQQIKTVKSKQVQ